MRNLNPKKRRLALAVSQILLVSGFAANPALAANEEQAKELERVEVTAPIFYRDRTDDPATLVYDLEYFQRFEPLTVGDMLKRVPSVAFLSDVLEYDGVRMRGLDPGYTQILINDKRVPGAGLDRSFFVDRIPAELVDRIEIVRSSSADRSGDAIAGTLNIVLRDGYSLDGGYIRFGGLRYDDAQWEPSISAIWGGEWMGGQLLIGANNQGRRNPKTKYSQRFSEPNGSLDDTERQSDVRSGDDSSFNADYSHEIGDGKLQLSAFYVRTDRLQEEDSIEYRGGIETFPNLLTTNINDLDILTTNYALQGGYEFPQWGGESEFRVNFAAIDDEQFELEDEYEYLRDTVAFPEADRFTGDRTQTKIEDQDFSAEWSHQREWNGMDLKFGVDFVRKTRDTKITEDRNRITIPNTQTTPLAIPGEFGPFLAVSGGDNEITEQRMDPYVRLKGEADAIEWELGARYQHTDLDIEDFTVDASESRYEKSNGIILPSAHLRYNLSTANRITASLARTMRRPGFDQISPALLTGELGDNDLLGNPNLSPESAWGLDVGFESRLGKRGIIGFNVFYRDITDLIEIANTGIEGDDGPGTFVLQPRNSGSGQVWGAEFDFSSPLTILGLDDTGVFFNYSWLDSEIDDFAGTRRFNDQSNFVLNLGFIHDLPSWNASFGASYRRQGDAFGRIVGEEVYTSYDGDLEAFIEKRVGTNWTMRLTGSNLLNASKDEIFNKFPTIVDQLNRDFDEYELETEAGGRVYQVMFRYAFD